MFVRFAGQHQDITYALRVDELHFLLILLRFELHALYFILAVKTAIGAIT